MDRRAVEAWLDAYGRAWETLDPAAAMDLFAEDAGYQETPYQEPMKGRPAIGEYWSKAAVHQRDVRFGYEVLHAEERRAIAHWWASYTAIASGEATKLDGIFLLEFDDQGLCTSLREWWHATPGPAF